MIHKILVVCIGNICRSPIAEHLIKMHFPSMTVTSAGISACVGQGAHRYSQSVMTANGFDISSHVARQIDGDMALKNDLILVMTNVQKRDLERMFPAVRGRVYRLGEWLDKDISDPNGKELSVFEETFKDIEMCVASWGGKLI